MKLMKAKLVEFKEISFKTMKVTKKKKKVFHNLTRGQIVNVDSLLHTCV